MLAFTSNAKRKKKLSWSESSASQSRPSWREMADRGSKTITAHKRQQIQSEKSFFSQHIVGRKRQKKKKKNYPSFWQQRKLSAVFGRKDVRARLRQRKKHNMKVRKSISADDSDVLIRREWYWRRFTYFIFLTCRSSLPTGAREHSFTGDFLQHVWWKGEVVTIT